MSRKNFSLTNTQIGEIINPLELSQGITVDPDANFTGSIAFTIKGYITS